MYRYYSFHCCFFHVKRSDLGPVQFGERGRGAETVHVNSHSFNAGIEVELENCVTQLTFIEEHILKVFNLCELFNVCPCKYEMDLISLVRRA